MNDNTWRTSEEPTTLLRCLGGSAPPLELWLFVWHTLARHLRASEGAGFPQLHEAAMRAISSGAEPEWRLAVAALQSVPFGSRDGLEELGASRAPGALRAAEIASEASRRIALYEARRPSGPGSGAWPDLVPFDRHQLAALREGECREQADLLRELFPSPFRAPNPGDAWRTAHGGLVPALARQMFDEDNFDHLPVLGDALEDAGCRDDWLLAHCRRRAGHVRGCWAIDLLRDG